MNKINSTPIVKPVGNNIMPVKDSWGFKVASGQDICIDGGNCLSTAGGSGEANTASNVGTAGVGVYKQKNGVDLEFKKINAGSNKITVTDNTTNSEVDIDVDDTNLSINASQVTDFDTEVSNNADVSANTSARHSAVTVTDSAEIDFTLTGQDITASIVTGSIDETKLDTSTNASLDLADSAMQDLVDDTTPQLGGELDAQAHSIGFTLQTATGDGTTTINWQNGNKFKFTFGAQNETFTFTAPSKPCSLQLILVQDSVGGRTITLPSTVKYPSGTAPTLSTSANAIDILSFLYDGNSYFCTSSLNFS